MCTLDNCICLTAKSDFVGITLLAAAMPGVEELDGERVSRAAYLMVKGSIGE